MKKDEIEKSNTKLVLVLKLLVELSAIVAIFGFSASALLNDLVFKKWGLSFVQVASLSDVVMSGSSFAFSTLPTLLTSIFISVLMYFSVGKLLPKLEHFEKSKPYLDALFGFLIALFLLSMLSIPIIDYLFDRKINNLSLIFAISSFLFGCRIIYVEIYFEKKEKEKPLSIILSWFFMITTLSVGAFSIYHWFDGKISRYSMGGYNHSKILVLSKGEPFCGAESTLMWIGSQSAVIKCEIKRTPNKKIYTTTRNLETIELVSNLKVK